MMLLTPNWYTCQTRWYKTTRLLVFKLSYLLSPHLMEDWNEGWEGVDNLDFSTQKKYSS